jgi:hypothetical protein
MGASYDPYTVNQTSYSLNAIAIGADRSTLQLCGVRVFYQTTGALAELAAPEAASTTAVVPETALDSGPPVLDASALPAKAFAHDLQLSQGAVAQGLRVYYSNGRTPDGYVQTWNYNGTLADYLGTTTTTGHSGFSSTYQAFAPPYTVDHFVASLGVVPWVVYNPTYKYCGERVFSMEGTTARYRFIAGSAFHPRSSATRYTYEGTGCIAVFQSSSFIPAIVR